MGTLQELIELYAPMCENCQAKRCSLAFMDNEEEILPSYGIPPWCETCLENVDWQVYWLKQAKTEYESGKRQS